jgi:predicted metalloprotease with PDZ domain
MDGEYLANGAASGFQYRVNINPNADARALAHVSWRAGEQGVLMLADLLPQISDDFSAKIKFEVPTDWKIIANEKSSGEKMFDVASVERAIFAVGENWREIESENKAVKLAISGEWKFTDAEAARFSGEIFEEYKKIFADAPDKKAQIFLSRFPQNTNSGRWQAETRGANLTILSSDMPFKTLSLQRLHEQLRHELFHLWIPNNLALEGNYAWFYEGFTIYQALKTGVAMNQIRFEDFLATLSEAYNLENFSEPSALAVALPSKTPNNFYSRGMLIAFLCDVALLRESRGKRSINDVLREIYQKHRFPNQTQNANAAILKILKSRAELLPTIKNYIEGAEKINWQNDLESIGIETKAVNSRSETQLPENISLSLKSKLNGRQKEILNNLGYNNWRKIAR